MALTIGQVAKAAHVNVETLRYYERRGLVLEPPRGPSLYRHYPEGTVRDGQPATNGAGARQRVDGCVPEARRYEAARRALDVPATRPRHSGIARGDSCRRWRPGRGSPADPRRLDRRLHQRGEACD